jgi:hypothetical protein
MRMAAGLKRGSLGLARGALPLMTLSLLAGCPAPPAKPPASPAAVPTAAVPTAAASAGALAAGHVGRPYDVLGSESLLTVVVYRAGPLARSGHNHVITSHDLSGTFYVPAELSGASFELHVPVAGFIVDEPQSRAAEGADFPPEVPAGAIAGTRRNMLGAAVLAAEQFPEIVLTSSRINLGAEPQHAWAEVEARVRGQSHSVRLVASFELNGEQLSIDGTLPLKQTELGLTPLSALMGALQVQDEMRVRFHILARRPGAS